MKISYLRFKSIACGSCADVIQRAVKSLPGVNECWVSVELKQATIEYDPESITFEAIHSGLEKAGYEVELLPEQATSIPT